MKKYLFIIFSFLSIFALFSCSSNDNEEKYVGIEDTLEVLVNDKSFTNAFYTSEYDKITPGRTPWNKYATLDDFNSLNVFIKLNSKSIEINSITFYKSTVEHGCDYERSDEQTFEKSNLSFIVDVSKSSLEENQRYVIDVSVTYKNADNNFIIGIN